MGNKKLTDAENASAKAAAAVKNYGDFATSNSTNAYLKDRNDAYGAVANYGDFAASDALKVTERNKINADNAVKNYGDFSYGLQSSYDDVINQILNRKDFSYDVNGDALYQQYKDQYVNQGKMAMMDTMGQAAAMTGGYGNSYAQSVGQQAYQGYLQQLTDKIPELYQVALDKYNSEGESLYNQYSMLSDDRATQYGEWADGYNRLVADRDYYNSDYYNKYNQEYGKYTDKYGRLVDRYNFASDAFNTGFNQDYTKWESGLNKLIDQRDYTYGAYRDAISDQQWQKNFDESVRQADASLQYDATGTTTLSDGTKVTKTIDNTKASTAVPSYVTDKAKTLTVNEDLHAYLASLESQDIITEEQSDALYETYKNTSLTGNKWVMDYDGGYHIGKLDGDAKVSFDGNVYTIDELYDALQKEGMSKDEAKTYLVNLQTKLGIT